MTSQNTLDPAVGCCDATVLHMVCGKIASGKSTLTARLAETQRTVLISEDGWLAHLYPDEIHTLTDYVRRAARLKTVLSGHIQSLLAAGISVVLDFPFNTIDTRAWGHSLARSAGCDHRLHYLDVSDEICKARLRARNASGEHPFETSDAQYELITRHFVPPTPGEGFELVVYDETGGVRGKRESDSTTRPSSAK
ncbi:ATP-binding protein [Paraburkholderia sp. BL21I4N1]|uniref:AAA family ATPase n=1 Tax=Paraburkholderia sp. BL21I4N1 TaxID=1938801 RepID=UPI000CFB78B9|nr:ATP-binding protein [Paraburkholderia sp. BL21I4N1]PQV49360.1 putative kinase [Paraburkholderia sp. BL21I4N1]